MPTPCRLKITDLEKQCPWLEISTLYDSSSGIKDSVDNLLRDGLFGAFFAALVIFVFLLTVRSTLVTAVSIPLSIVTAIVILGAQGITLNNIMTVSSIAGVVDDVAQAGVLAWLDDVDWFEQAGLDEDTVIARLFWAMQVASARGLLVPQDAGQAEEIAHLIADEHYWAEGQPRPKDWREASEPWAP